ncbi:MAG: MFS transporter [Alphaproteobacteria bacterium]
MMRDRVAFLFLNLGHLYDHMFMALYSLVVVVMVTEFNMTYAEMLPLATPGFIAFGAGALPAGWLADRWSRPGMLTVFFLGIGSASILTGLASTPLQIGLGLFGIGLFASIYHPVGIPMVVEGRDKIGRALGINGVFGNLGFSVAFVVAGAMLDFVNWQAAFIVPGAVAIVTGLAYMAFARGGTVSRVEKPRPVGDLPDRRGMIRVLALIALTTSFGGVIFHATTVSLPKVFDERVPELSVSALGIGSTAALIFLLAAFAQIVVGGMIDRYRMKTVYLVVAGFQIPLFLIALSLTGMPLLMISLCFMLLVFGVIPINDAIVARNTTAAVRGRVYAMKYVLSLTVGAVAVPLVAFMHGTGGFSGLFVVLSFCAAGIVATILFLMHERVTASEPATAAGD